MVDLWGSVADVDFGELVANHVEGIIGFPWGDQGMSPTCKTIFMFTKRYLDAHSPSGNGGPVRWQWL